MSDEVRDWGPSYHAGDAFLSKVHRRSAACRRPGHPGLGSSILEVGVLYCDLVPLEGEDVAARNLDLLALAARGREEPLRQTPITRDKVSCVAEMHVGESPEHAGEAF